MSVDCFGFSWYEPPVDVRQVPLEVFGLHKVHAQLLPQLGREVVLVHELVQLVDAVMKLHRVHLEEARSKDRSARLETWKFMSLMFNVRNTTALVSYYE
jgi:hypothetical protein